MYVKPPRENESLARPKKYHREGGGELQQTLIFNCLTI